MKIMKLTQGAQTSEGWRAEALAKRGRRTKDMDQSNPDK